MIYVRETVVTTKNENNTIKVSPFGVYIENDVLKLKPFKPSISLDNILRNNSGVINYIDDVKNFCIMYYKKILILILKKLIKLIVQE